MINQPYEDRDSMPSGYKAAPPEIIVYCGVQWTGWNYQAQLKVDSRNNKVIRSQECFRTQIEAAKEFVRMCRDYRGDILHVDVNGGRLKVPFRSLSPYAVKKMIEDSRKERAKEAHVI
jgi:hypothetical protein